MNVCHITSNSGIIYGEVKVHKPVEDNCPSFRPILSANGTPTYDLAQFFVPILKTENGCIVHDSFSFASEVSKSNSKNLMASLDIENIFTNIRLVENTDNIINDYF